VRIEGNGAPADGYKVVTIEVKQGLINEENKVTVTAFFVDHHPNTPAFGYKIEYNSRSVVISGDTN
jgi:ribonuclease Z